MDGEFDRSVDRIMRSGQEHPAGAGAAATADPAPYPRELEHVAQLRDGAVLRIRPIRPDDEPRLVALYDRLSEHTAYQRFFTVLRRLPPDWARFFANVDYRRRLALVAERGTPAGIELVGVGRYESTAEPDVAELAFVVQDGWQGRGLGEVLLRDVLRAGEARGLRRFRAYVLGDNHRMLRLLARHAEILERTIEGGVVALLLRRRPEGGPGA
jgi:RimJ/RimL family protein N-acetyltransferase